MYFTKNKYNQTLVRFVLHREENLILSWKWCERSWWHRPSWENCLWIAVSQPRMPLLCTIEIRGIWKWCESLIDLMAITWKSLEDVFGISKCLSFNLNEKCKHKINKCFSIVHRLIIIKTTKNLTAKVQHYTGRTILESSTDEWSLSKQLYRPYDMSAYINFGRVSFTISAYDAKIFILLCLCCRYLPKDALKQASSKWKTSTKHHPMVNWSDFWRNLKTMASNWLNRHAILNIMQLTRSGWTDHGWSKTIENQAIYFICRFNS